MQKAPQATFKGQVKRGYDTWKRGRVEFFVETEAGSWTVQFYHDVNPGRVVHRYKSLLGKSASIVFKCNRLIIGDKSDGELHIKIPELEATNAQRLVKKITDFNMSTPSRNRAEVGLASSQNGFSGSNGKSSSNVSTLAWLSKKTPPPSYQQERNHTSSAKRKIDLDSSERQNGPSSDKRGEGRSMVDNMGCYELDDDEEEEVSFPRFTEMKNYSKSQNNSSTVANFGKGLGPLNFYGVDNSLMTENTYRGLNRKPASSTSPSNQSCLRSPKVKRPKLSDLDDADIENKVSTSSKALLKGALSNRMSGRIPTLSDPQDLGENDQHRANLDSSGHHSDGQTVGFDNLGNTCFMNSSLQCLSALEPLSVDIQSAVSKYGSQLPPNSVTKMLYLLMKDVRRPNVRPERVREILSRIRRDISAKFASNTQHDALELLNVLVDRADDEISPLLTRSLGDADTPNKELAEKSNSPSTSTDGENQEVPKSPSEDPTVKVTPSDTNFGWVSSSTVFFHECKSVLLVSTYQKETFLLLPLESKVNMNLQDCIDKYFNANEVEYFCTNCRKLEKGTMTTKVVKRPRCFIMALLRYTSVNLEYIKKHDNVHIPRFVSVADFGVEDMKAAPLVDPVFMLDRFHDANLPSESAGGAEQVSSPAVEAARRGHISTLAMMDDKEVADAEPERHSSLTQTMRRVVETYENLQNEGKEKENLLEGEPQSKQEMDPDVRERLTIKRLANHLADQFAEVEQHIEMAREAAEDFTEIYTEAQCIIEKMSDLVKSHLEESYKFKAGETTQSDSYLMAEQNLLCDVLVQRALVSEEESDDDFDYRRVRRRLISLRYCNVHGEVAKMNHLTNDLAMYLAAKEVGVVVDPDLPKHRRKSSSHDVGDRKVSATSDHNYECEKGTEKSGLGREEGDGECTSQGEVFMEEDIGNRGSLEVNPSASLGFEQTENWQGASPQDKDKTREHPRESSHLRSEKSAQSRTERMSERKVNGAEEDSSGAMADVSNNATINTTIGLNSSVCDPGFLEDAANGSAVDDLDPLFLGQPVSEWLETELADIDVNGLGEEDLMIYAQALSRFEYLREQMNHRAATTAAEAEAKMPPPPPDSFTLDNIMDSNEDTAISYDDSSTSSAQAKAGSGNASQESFEQSGEKLHGEDSPTASSVSDSDKDASMPYSPVSERDPIVKSRSPKEELSPEKVPELHCDESLSDLDEPDGNVDDPANVKVKGLKGGQRGSQTGSSSRTKRKLSANEKHIGSSEHVAAKDKQISPINSSPSLTSKVLSPNKGLSNHVNTLPSATVSSLSETNAPKASHGNHSPRQHLSPKASALPTTSGSVSALPTTSGSVSGPKKSESNSNNRDIQMLSPSASQVSPRRDNYSVSQSKTARNELARLRSPSSVSPRKRVCKESAPSSHSCSKVKAGSASKRLLFEDENKNNNRAESLVKRTLAPETKGKGLIDNLPKNFPMQEDLIKGGTLAKSEDGELPDPDGIHKLLSPRKSERPDKILSARVSQLQSGGDDQAITIISNPSNIPHPVPVASSRNNTVKTIKTESHQVLSPSTLRREEDNQSSNLTSSSGEPNMPKCEAPLDDEKAELARITPKSKNTRPQLSGNDEKENVADSLTARERMQNIEMGKADCTYRLVGMVNHHGESLNAGHYTAYSLNFNKQRWYHMDDKHTKATSESAARTESVNSGYVFFYMDKELFERYAKKATERQQRKS